MYLKNNIYKNGGVDMATSSITNNFVINDKSHIEQFANAIEQSYIESLHRSPAPDLNITYLRGSDDIKNFMGRRKNLNGK